MRVSILTLLWFVCGIAVSAFGAEPLYRKSLSHLDNPQRNLDETERSLDDVREQVTSLMEKSIDLLTESDRLALRLDELSEYRVEIEGDFNGLLDDPGSDDLDAPSRKRFLKILFSHTVWIQGVVAGARAEVASAKRKGIASRFHPDPRQYEDRLSRDVLPEEHADVLASVAVMIPLLQKKDYAMLIRKCFSYDPATPLSDEDFARTLMVVQHKEAVWQDILAAFIRGEVKGFTMKYEKLNEVRIRPVADDALPPTWTFVQLYFRPGVPGCAVWNWQ